MPLQSEAPVEHTNKLQTQASVAESPSIILLVTGRYLAICDAWCESRTW
ncbi:Dynein-like protein [Giardia duodenalis assemblage B]|uniref:Dynein-like protein n=1 Tax=Giardia duodenalis assemblage B TaxID=1394984 RepID=A0A132NM78_GIAIN|nr:Dynein-like protein [Giardia intestinalis assemblage B]